LPTDVLSEAREEVDGRLSHELHRLCEERRDEKTDELGGYHHGHIKLYVSIILCDGDYSALVLGC